MLKLVDTVTFSILEWNKGDECELALTKWKGNPKILICNPKLSTPSSASAAAQRRNHEVEDDM